MLSKIHGFIYPLFAYNLFGHQTLGEEPHLTRLAGSKPHTKAMEIRPTKTQQRKRNGLPKKQLQKACYSKVTWYPCYYMIYTPRHQTFSPNVTQADSISATQLGDKVIC